MCPPCTAPIGCPALSDAISAAPSRRSGRELRVRKEEARAPLSDVGHREDVGPRHNGFAGLEVARHHHRVPRREQLALADVYLRAKDGRPCRVHAVFGGDSLRLRLCARRQKRARLVLDHRLDGALLRNLAFYRQLLRTGLVERRRGERPTLHELVRSRKVDA